MDYNFLSRNPGGNVEGHKPHDAAHTMVALLLVTHDKLGACMLDIASDILQYRSPLTGTVSVAQGEGPEAVAARGREAIHALDQGDGVLVMSDLYGSTPGNASRLLLEMESGHVQVLWGVNMPMLLRALDYQKKGKPLADLAELAFSGCIAGVLRPEPTPEPVC